MTGAAALLLVVAPAQALGGAGHTEEGSAPFCDPFDSGWALTPATSNARLSPGAVAAGVDPASDVRQSGELIPPEQRPARRLRRDRASSTVRVPVYFHVITKNGGTTGAVGDQEIADQMAILNDSFDGTTGGEDVDFEFELVSIDRHDNASWYDDPGPASPTLNVNGVRNMNVYTGSAGGYLGYVNFLPGEAPTGGSNDYVVIHHSTLPGGTDGTPYEEGDTLVHEVGHWLGLEHTFANGCLPPGDEIDDTPYEGSPNFGSDCVGPRNTCPQPGNDPINNFMDYSDDICMYEFTSGQADRMHTRTGLYRNTAPTIGADPVRPIMGAPEPVAVTRSDADGDETTTDVVTAPGHGEVSVGGGGGLTYTPDPGYIGADSFEIRAADIFGVVSSPITVPVDVSPHPLDLEVDAPGRSRFKRLGLSAGCGAGGCELRLTGKVVATEPRKRRRAGVAGRRFSAAIRPRSATVPPGGTVNLKPSLWTRQARKVQRILNRGGKGKAKLTVAASAAGGQTASRPVRIKLQR